MTPQTFTGGNGGNGAASAVETMMTAAAAINPMPLSRLRARQACKSYQEVRASDMLFSGNLSHSEPLSPSSVSGAMG